MTDQADKDSPESVRAERLNPASAEKSALASDADADAAVGVVVTPRRRTASVSKPSFRHGILLVSVLGAAGAAILALVLGGMKDNSIYAKSVDDLIKERVKFQGRAVRAEGNLVHGTLVRRESPCEYRFSIEKHGTVIPVRYAQCVVPDTFRDIPNMDVGVTVEGKLLGDNSFEATNVLAKCPSKYEMKERQQRGEVMPQYASPTQM
jgi:cytochrome c-type biogenesis protein CcmE